MVIYTVDHSHTKIAPLVTKITYIKMDPLNPIRNGFVNPSPMDSHFYCIHVCYLARYSYE